MPPRVRICLVGCRRRLSLRWEAGEGSYWLASGGNFGRTNAGLSEKKKNKTEQNISPGAAVQSWEKDGKELAAACRVPSRRSTGCLEGLEGGGTSCRGH